MKPTKTVAAVAGIILAVAGSAVAAGPALAATTYYVSPTGVDTANGTSTSTPWKTLSKIHGFTFAAGDTVKLQAGATWTGGFTIIEAGTATLPITVTSYGTGAKPKITGGRSGYCVQLMGAYLVADGIETDSCGYGGIGVTADHDTVRNSYVSGNAAGIYYKDAATNGSFVRNTLVDNNVMNVLTPCATACNDDSGAFGFLVHGNSGVFEWNAVSGSNAFSYDYGRDGGAFEIYNGSNNTFDHNTSTDNTSFSESGHGTGRSSTGNHFYYNKITATCGANCVDAIGLNIRGSGSQYGPNTGTVFNHNTVYLTGANTKGVVCGSGCSATLLTVKGNIVKADRQAMYAGATPTESYNVWLGPKAGVWTMNSNSTTVDPSFVNTSTLDLRLSSGSSSASDRAGSTNYAFDLHNLSSHRDGDCNGTAFSDSGAYEFQPTAC